MKQINFFKNFRVIDAFWLKMIAIVAMVIDHVGLLFFPDVLELRIIGRISLPLFAFLLTEGFLKTRDLKKYLTRLAVFALVSQIPFSLMNFAHGGDLYMLNIFFELLVGLAALALMAKQKNIWVKLLIIGLAAVLAFVCNVDYSAYGILMIAALYVMRFKPVLGAWLFVGLNVLTLIVDPYLGIFQIVTIAVLPIIFSYNERPGPRISRWWFYWFYPAHMLFLTGLYFILSR